MAMIRRLFRVLVTTMFLASEAVGGMAVPDKRKTSGAVPKRITKREVVAQVRGSLKELATSEVWERQNIVFQLVMTNG